MKPPLPPLDAAELAELVEAAEKAGRVTALRQTIALLGVFLDKLNEMVEAEDPRPESSRPLRLVRR